MSANQISSPAMRRRWACAGAVAAALGVLGSAIPARADCTVDCETSACNICVDDYSVLDIDSSQSTNCIDVAAGSILNITEGATLTITRTECAQTSCVNGDVILRYDLEWTPARLAFTCSDHGLVGSGAIAGQEPDAAIIISADVTLKSAVDITGSLQIVGAGDFGNAGRVSANSPYGTLNVAVTGTVSDGPGARWEVGPYAAAVLRFLSVDANLSGSFTVTNGMLIAGDRSADTDEIDVCTTGNLTQTGGEIEVGRYDSFSFSAQTCP